MEEQSDIEKIISVENVKTMKSDFAKAHEMLNKRYAQCDKYGHIDPLARIGVLDSCHWCYRHTSYATPETDARVNEERSLPFMDRPMNAALNVELSRKEIGFGKLKDHSRGLTVMLKKIENERNLSEAYRVSNSLGFKNDFNPFL